MATPTAPLRVPYKTVNKTGIPTDIYLPGSTSHELSPVLIMIHGGGFILGHSSMNNKDQIEDCLQRGWIVLSIEHRLCPGVDLLEGPMTDVRDCLQWAQQGGLAEVLQEASSNIKPDPDRVMAMGTSAGGHLSLSLAWGVPKPPLAILDFYGAKDFGNPFWLQPIPALLSRLPPAPPASLYESLYTEKETFMGGVSLEGQASPAQAPDLADPRQALTLYGIANGKSLQSIWPRAPEDFHLIDPIMNVDSSWPPTAIVHGNADFMIPISISRNLEKRLKESGVETAFYEVEGEPHTFVGKMVKGSETWKSQRRGFDFLESVLKKSYA